MYSIYVHIYRVKVGERLQNARDSILAQSYNQPVSSTTT